MMMMVIEDERVSDDDDDEDVYQFWRQSMAVDNCVAEGKIIDF